MLEYLHLRRRPPRFTTVIRTRAGYLGPDIALEEETAVSIDQTLA
jgi:hypothetical protein